MNTRVIYCLICLCALTLASCAPKIAAPDAYDVRDASDAAHLYKSFTYTESPFRILFSVRAGTQKDGISDTRRVTGVLWGNTTSSVRMDISAGIGALIARSKEDASGLTVHLPYKKSMYMYPNRSWNHEDVFGIPLPFSLRESASLALGNFSAVFDPDHAKVTFTHNECVLLLTDGARRGELHLSPAGLPVRWTDVSGWETAFVYRDDETRPFRLSAHHKNGTTALIFLKEIEQTPPFNFDRLQLEAPEGTTIFAVTD